ncbi:MAG: Ig-like domain-containing protein [Candidatus Hydrogenedentes bacterium]|nr:Ig-like domain-containing protein [Candidatus Hydrogenedentota bacterium]
MFLPLLLAAIAHTAHGQGFPNVARTPGDLLAGPIAPEQGRTAIVGWHGERIVSVPEAPGSQVGADLQIRIVSLENLDGTGPEVTVVPAPASGFHAHGYYQTGPYMFVGPHCLGDALDPCNSTYPHDVWANAFRIGGAGTPIGDSQLRRGTIDDEIGLLLGSVQRAGAQSPWGLNDFWTYNDISGDMFLAVRRNNEWVYDWGNGGATTGPAIKATWDHLGLTGVTGFPFIMGNILVVASDQAGSGVATYDISDLSNPVLLDVLKDGNPGGYWPEIYGHYIFFPRRDGEGGVGSQAGYMVVDFEDPADLKIVANRNVAGSNQYVTFQDEFAFMNRYKIDMRTFDVALELNTIPGVIDASQFALPVGNLVITGGYGSDGPGLAVWAHQAAPDTRGPYVAYHVPVPDQTNFSIDCPITLSIPESLKTETIVDGTSLILRPVGGMSVATWHAFGQGKLLTVTPQQPLQAETTYELILTSDIEDAAGNGLEPYSFRFSTGGGLSGGNQPPVVTSVTVAPETPAPGQLVTISWAGNDPDSDPIEFRVDYGDGSPLGGWSSSTSAMRSYTDPGHYQLTVQIRDALGAVSAVSRKITVTNLPAAPGATASSLLALDSAGGFVYAVNPDNDTVSAVDTAAGAKLWEAPVGAHPQGIARAGDGNLWVVCRDSDEIYILDSGNGATLSVLDLDYGARPVAIAPVPGGASMLISLEGTGELARFDVSPPAPDGTVQLGPYPRAIAVSDDGTRALVTRFISGEHAGSIYDVDLSGAMTFMGAIPLRRDQSEDGSASGRGVPNYLSAVHITPDGQWAWVVGKKDNTTRGTFFGPNMAPGQDSTVRALLMLIDLGANSEDLSLRLDLDNSDSPSAIAFSPLGDYAFIALQGNNQVGVIDVFDLMQQASPGTLQSRWGTGLAPQAIVMDPASGALISKDFMGRSVTLFDAANFISSGSLNIPSAAVDTVATEQLAPQVLLGKRIFYNAADTRMSAEGYISCASCHLDGGHDGRTWDFTSRGEGFRNTTDLRGRSGLAHGNVHWTANFDEIQDFENDIRAFFGGSGFLSNAEHTATADPLGAPKAGLDNELDALAAYVRSLGAATLPRSPGRAPDGTESAAAVRGQAVFNAQNCDTCHIPEEGFTDRLLHNVGTLRASSGQRLGGPLTGIETPTLLGIHAAAPYFHDGSAATLEEVFSLTGGRMVQAEDAVLGGGAFAEDIPWFPMKEWHQSELVHVNTTETVTFDDVESNGAGSGYVEIRYSLLYANGALNVSINGGAPQEVPLTMSPNNPSYVPTEWRRVRVPVDYVDGTNSVTISKAWGGTFYLDDALFSTPEDAALADAHVRGLSMGDLEDLSAYLISLDSQSAPPDPVGEGEGLVVVTEGTNVVYAGLGDSIALRVTVDGTPPYGYQWYSGYEGKMDAIITGATGPSLVLSNIDFDDAGYYYCVVEDANETAESPLFQVLVFTNVPVTGTAGLLLLILGAAALGMLRHRRE